MNVYIGQNIKRLRNKMKLTQPQLAEKLGVTTKVISDYELSKANPPPHLLPEIAKFFGVTLDELFGINEIQFDLIPEVGNQHGNNRSVQLLKFFGKLTPEEQRVTLKQIKALAKENCKNK